MSLVYESVPKDPQGNLEYRNDLSRLYEVPEWQWAIKDRCEHDLLFWINSFLWTFDPRKVDAGESPDIPWITWGPQDKCLLTCNQWLGKRDIGIEKSRDQGASWNCLVLFLHEWQFKSHRSFMIVSRKEELVDSPSNTDSLFWKLDYMLACQPAFLKPKFVRTKLHLENTDGNCYLDGSSTTADVGRGGRRTAILIDEFAAFETADSYAVNAATAPNTNCRIFNSTYLGAVGSFYEQLQRQNIVKISLPWWEHPEHSKGLVITDGKKWSPWYAEMCQRIITPARIAAELDMDPTGSSSPFFPAALIDRILNEDIRPPVMRGRLEVHPFDQTQAQWMDDARGPFLLWMNLPPPKFRPNPNEKFVMGIDVATGVGASNSVLSIGSRTTREKVGEFASAKLDPAAFAEFAVGVAHFFNDAYMIWESNGPGIGFGQKVVELGYRNIYYMQDEFGLRHKLADNMVPGWHSSQNNKRLVFQAYASALSNHSFTNRSLEAIRECRLITYTPEGNVCNSLAQAMDDPSGARENHGDRPTADALCSKALGDAPRASLAEGQITPNPARYSFAWRKQEAERELTAGPLKDWETDPRELNGWQEADLGISW